jgi:4a-hydroxytetrahydrobiopterin dehydratase
MKYLKKFLKGDDLKLTEHFNFTGVVEAVDFMRGACDVFDELDHHPDYFCLDGKTVTIQIWTHSEGKVTDKDFEVVETLEELIRDCCRPLNNHLFK